MNRELRRKADGGTRRCAAKRPRVAVSPLLRVGFSSFIPHPSSFLYVVKDEGGRMKDEQRAAEKGGRGDAEMCGETSPRRRISTSPRRFLFLHPSSFILHPFFMVGVGIEPTFRVFQTRANPSQLSDQN